MSIRVSWLEFDSTSSPLDVNVSWLEFDSTSNPSDVKVSWLEFDSTSNPSDVKVSWLEFDSSANPQDIRVSWLEFDTQAIGLGDHIPIVGGAKQYKRVNKFKEEEKEAKTPVVWEHTVFAKDVEIGIEQVTDKVSLDALAKKRRRWKILILMLDS